MSALAGSSHSESHNTRWLIGGVIASVLLHLSVAIAYLWTPSFDFTPAPSASPIAVSLVAPLAAPSKITSDTQKSVAVEAPKPEPAPLVEQQQPEITSPVTSQESKESPKLQKHHQVPQKPKPKIKPVETKKKPEEKEKRYPRKVKRLRKQGMPVIRFTINREGQVLDVELVRSSGTDSLDKEAMDLVYRAQPLIKPPQSVLGQQISLTVPIGFSF
jgi:protein TonB